MHATIRQQRQHAFLRYWLVSNVVLLLPSMLIPPLALFLSLNLVLGFVHRRKISKAFISTASCYHCGVEIDLVDSAWACGCGFRRAGGHAFDPCPGCSSHISQMPCPSCQMTLLI